MAKSPPFKRPRGTGRKSLVGVKPCGCITAAQLVDTDTTVKQVREFYTDMSESARAVAWMENSEIKRRLFQPCKVQHG
jgi:hypothetical protein